MYVFLCDVYASGVDTTTASRDVPARFRAMCCRSRIEVIAVAKISVLQPLTHRENALGYSARRERK